MIIGKTIVVALGGNALGKNPEEQLQLVKIAAQNICDLIVAGNKVIITHGNGPQVGMINLAFDYAHQKGITCAMPFPESNAMSEGYIGYHLQQAVQMELKRRKLKRGCISLITQVEVDSDDPAFKNPTKPIGSFYSKDEATKLGKENNWVFKEDAGRGYRRVVPSPKPQKIVEINIIKKLLRKRDVIIAGGGGGIAVINDNNKLQGIDAVIDKDMTSSLLASSLKADILLILTSVSEVAIGYNTPEEKKIKKMDLASAKAFIENNEFASGSMLPKINACYNFLMRNHHGMAIITSLENAKKALQGKKGTIIFY
jgi:carbamate kinase